MKKSKIIAPALGVLILSTAAAVTGTVAWFTATRVRTIGMNGISAVNPEQGLKLTYAKAAYSSPVTIASSTGHYTANTGVVEEGATLTVSHVQLRDASVNMAASDPAVFGSVLDETSGDLSAIAAKDFATPDSKQYDGEDVYFATAFELKFSVDRAESGYKQHLIFDESRSSVTAPAAASDETKSIKKAMRVGFKTSSDWFVWAPFTSDAVGTTADVSLRYVTAAGDATGASAYTTAFYTSAQIILGNDTAAVSSSYAADTASVDSLPALATVTAYAGYLGELSTSDLSVKVVTWFEGTDSSCVNTAEALAEEFTANLNFCMRKSKTA